MEESPIGTHAQELGSEAQRKDERDSLLVLAQLRLDGSGKAAETVRVRNVSSGGLMAQASEAYHVGASVEVELEGIGPVQGSVAWAEAGRIGIAFDHPINKANARKPKPVAKTEPETDLYRPVPANYRRPPLKPR